MPALAPGVSFLPLQGHIQTPECLVPTNEVRAEGAGPAPGPWSPPPSSHKNVLHSPGLLVSIHDLHILLVPAAGLLRYNSPFLAIRPTFRVVTRSTCGERGTRWERLCTQACPPKPQIKICHLRGPGRLGEGSSPGLSPGNSRGSWNLPSHGSPT